MVWWAESTKKTKKHWWQRQCGSSDTYVILHAIESANKHISAWNTRKFNLCSAEYMIDELWTCPLFFKTSGVVHNLCLLPFFYGTTELIESIDGIHTTLYLNGEESMLTDFKVRSQIMAVHSWGQHQPWARRYLSLKLWSYSGGINPPKITVSARYGWSN